jgi:hypothetical protein
MEKQTRRFWTTEEISYLKAHYKSETCKRIGLKINRTPGTVQFMAQKIGITKPNRTNGGFKKDIKWTEKEDKYLVDHYRHLTADKISQNMGRSIIGIYHRAFRLGLRGHIKSSKRRKSLVKINYYQWRELVRKVNSRDNFQCVLCGYSKHLAAHHIHPVREGGSDDITNLVTLCPNHHAEADAGEISATMLKLT